MKIVVDAFGGDNAPVEIVKGCINAVSKFDDVHILLVGNMDIVSAELAKQGYVGDKIELIDSISVISNNESPTVAIKTKKDSSLVVGLDLTSKRDDIIGFVSAGSTGAVLTGALLIVGRMAGILRPALAPPIPNIKGGKTILIDCGANMDSKPQFLTHFALMGSIYSQKMFGVENPRVALLNVGNEDKKGNELCHEVFPLLKDMKNINFVGNLEARDIFSGDADVVVTDGFAGNVALKSAEGTANLILSSLKKEIESGSVFEKFGALLIKKMLKRVVKKIDYNSIGGSVFLGVRKIVVKSHGSSDSKSILGSISLVRDVHLSGFVDELKKQIEEVQN